MDVHIVRPQGDMLVVQVVDGKVVIPPKIAPQTPDSAKSAGQKEQSEQ